MLDDSMRTLLWGLDIRWGLHDGINALKGGTGESTGG